MYVYEAIGETLRRLGSDTVFGLAGGANVMFLTHMTHQCGMRYFAARHESPAVSMADGYSRVSGKIGVASVTSGPGVTNALTALAEAVKGSSPMLLLAGDTAEWEAGTNQDIDQAAVAASVGVGIQPLRGADTFILDLAEAVERATMEERPIIVSVPSDLQTQACPSAHLDNLHPAALQRPPQPDEQAIRQLADLVQQAERPLVIAGRGAVRSGAHDILVALADRIGALLANTGQAKALFAGHPFQISVSGSFASDLGRKLIGQADVVLAFGASLNRWTTQTGRIFSKSARIAHCDKDPAAIGRRHPVYLGVTGDASATAKALLAELERRGFETKGFRSSSLADEIASYRPPTASEGPIAPGSIDPRTFFTELETLLPRERTVVLDSGRFMRYPAGYLSVPDPSGWVFTQDFQSVGLGIGSAIGAAAARPDRMTVAVVGDGGMLMSMGELETVVRYKIPMLLLVVNDHAYGPEVAMLERNEMPIDHAIFDDVDFAAIAASTGMQACTVRSLGDAEPIRSWLRNPAGPLLVDCKIDPLMPEFRQPGGGH